MSSSDIAEVMSLDILPEVSSTVEHQWIWFYIGFLLIAGGVKLNIMPCWPRPESTTMLAPTLSLELPVESTSVSQHSASQTLVSKHN